MSVKPSQSPSSATEGQGEGQTPPEPITALTPAGIEIRYTSAPKRKYEVRHHPDQIHHPLFSNYEGAFGWREVPSVTTVLDCLDKKGLSWWGMKVGVQGVQQLFAEGVIDRNWYGGDFLDAETYERLTLDQLIDLLTTHKLTVNHQRDKAGSRGVAVHDALETWARTGLRPDPKMFPEEEEGYVRGLLKFLDHVPSAEPEACEVIVGSLEYEYAGRYDLRIKTNQEHQVVYKRTPKRGDHFAVLAPGRLLTDLKTSSGVYPSHSRQLEAYEKASVECGYDPTDARGILHVTSDGHYEFVRSTAVFDDFLVVKRVWESEQDMKGRRR